MLASPTRIDELPNIACKKVEVVELISDFGGISVSTNDERYISVVMRDVKVE